ncbi:MAG: hypothetical protein WCS65_18480, partial [Verrucomicrobiae bacterium]
TKTSNKTAFFSSHKKLGLSGSGCSVIAPSVPPFPDGNVRRLLQSYPQEAEAARSAAPAFTRDALKTISGLEEQVLIRGVRSEP